MKEQLRASNFSLDIEFFVVDDETVLDPNSYLFAIVDIYSQLERRFVTVAALLSRAADTRNCA